MRMRFVLASFILLASPNSASAQSSQQQVADSSPFRALDLPAPNDVRTGSGRPGAKYWQQRADYKIAATLDPARNELRGRETIHYTNNSPDALPYLWLFVEQNLCAPNSITNQLNQPPLVFLGSSFDFSCQGFDGGGHMESLKVGGVDAKRTVYGTTMRIDLASPLASGASIDIETVWHFNVPAQGGGRMGHDGALYEMAQWYPRMCVYDDVHGWNHEPYIGAGEFYLEYGNFDVALTVPRSYIVAATGELTNPASVLTETQRSRLALARQSDTAIAIIDAKEVGNENLTRPGVAKFAAGPAPASPPSRLPRLPPPRLPASRLPRLPPPRLPASRLPHLLPGTTSPPTSATSLSPPAPTSAGTRAATRESSSRISIAPPRTSGPR